MAWAEILEIFLAQPVIQICSMFQLDKKVTSGQMLIEVVVAVGIIALVLVGVSDLMTRSLRVITFQKQRSEATALLQKIQNNYKAQRDSDPDNFYSVVADTVIDPCETGKPYKCTVQINKTVDDVTITAKAEWVDSDSTFSTSSVQTLQRILK